MVSFNRIIDLKGRAVGRIIKRTFGLKSFSMQYFSIGKKMKIPADCRTGETERENGFAASETFQVTAVNCACVSVLCKTHRMRTGSNSSLTTKLIVGIF